MALEEEGAGHEEGEDRTLVERLTDRARDGLRGEEEQKKGPIDHIEDEPGGR